VFSTTCVVNGICRPFTFFENKSVMFFHYIWYFLSFYIIILVIFIFCYGRILIVIRRQAKVMASHNTSQSSTTRTQTNQMQTTVIKTMIFVSALYAVLWSPYYILILMLKLSPSINFAQQSVYIGYDVSIFCAYLYTCINPFIYATKFQPVNQILRRMIPWKKSIKQANQNVAGAGIRLAAPRPGDARIQD